MYILLLVPINAVNLETDAHHTADLPTRLMYSAPPSSLASHNGGIIIKKTGGGVTHS